MSAWNHHSPSKSWARAAVTQNFKKFAECFWDVSARTCMKVQKAHLFQGVSRYFQPPILKVGSRDCHMGLGSRRTDRGGNHASISPAGERRGPNYASGPAADRGDGRSDF